MKMKNTFAIAAAIMAATVMSGYSVCAEDCISSENVTGDIVASAESEAENIVPGKTAVSKEYSCTSDAVRIHWEQCEGADGYDVYRYSSSAKKWERISTVSDTLNFRDDGLISGTTYMYRIRAFVQTDGAAVMGEFSDIITTATRPAKVEEKKTYTRTDNKIRINWNKVSGATGYEIYRKSSVNAAYKKIAAVGSSETEYLDRELKANQTYYYRVKAVKTVGGKTVAGESSDTIRTRTLFTQVKMKSGFSCTTNAVRINWNKVSGADGYQVFRWNGSAWKKVAVIRNGSTTTYRNNSLKAGTTYKYKVKAYKKTGTTYYTGYAGTTKTTVTRPAQTVMQTPNKTSDAVRVKWNKVSGASGYEIYQLKSGTWKKIKTVGASVTNYRIDGLKADTAYHFRVKAYKSIGGKKFTGKSSQVDVRTNKVVNTKLTQADIDRLITELQEYSNKRCNFEAVFNSEQEMRENIERRTPGNSSWDPQEYIFPSETYEEAYREIKDAIDWEYEEQERHGYDVHVVLYSEYYSNGYMSSGTPHWFVYLLV